jgi:hypothetical protein
MLPVAVTVLVEGSYSSAFRDSMSRTLPSGRRVAEKTKVDAVIAPVAVKVPVDGSYNSTFEVPPAIRTLPFGSKVAVWLMRGTIMLPVAVNVPVCA